MQLLHKAKSSISQPSINLSFYTDLFIYFYTVVFLNLTLAKSYIQYTRISDFRYPCVLGYVYLCILLCTFVKVGFLPPGGVSKLFFPKRHHRNIQGGGASHVTFCLPIKMAVYTDDTVWHRTSGESRYNLRSHPTTQYEQFMIIKQYYGRQGYSGRSKVTVIPSPPMG